MAMASRIGKDVKRIMKTAEIGKTGQPSGHDQSPFEGFTIDFVKPVIEKVTSVIFGRSPWRPGLTIDEIGCKRAAT